MTLLFVYNANSGKINTLFDIGHKLFSPKTYQCSLCALTYETFSEDTIWKSFREESSIAMEFYHKDEFEVKFPNEAIRYSVVLKYESGQLTSIINHKYLNKTSCVEELINQLKSSL